MALSRTAYGPYNHDNSGGAQGSGPFTTGSFTPPDNSLLVVIVKCGTDTPGSGDAGFVVTGGSLTWTKRIGRTATFTPDGFILQFWTAPVTTGASMTVTVTHTGISSYAFGVYPFAYTGYNTSSPTGATASGDDTNGTSSLTLSAAPASTSEVLAGLAMVTSDSGGAGTITEGSSFTEIAEAGFSASSFCRSQRQFRTGSTSDAVSWTSSGQGGSPYDRRIFAALEIKAAGTTDAAGTLAGTGALNATARATVSASGTLAGTGALNAVGRSSVAAFATLAGSGALNAVGRSTVSAAATLAGLGELSAVGSGGLADGASLIPPPTSGGAGGYLAPAEFARKFRKKKEPRRPRTHVIKIGDWPDEAVVAPPTMHDDGLDYNQLLAGLNIEDADTDDEEAMTLIMGLAA